MISVKKIPAKEIDKFCVISANAYSAMGCHVESEFKRLKDKITSDNKLKNISLWGAYKDKELVGGIRLFDFWGTLFETRILYGGGGFLAVDLAHKKEKVAHDLMLHFLRHYRELDAPLAILYPFRPDFYRMMGFGYGAKINEYRVKPADLPSGGGKEHIRFLEVSEINKMVACHNRVAAKTHGMLEKSGHELSRLKNPANRLIGYVEGNVVRGYLSFSYRQIDPTNFITNDMSVNEFVYESKEVLAELLCFLHTQADQNRRIRFVTSDDFLHFLPFDPRDDTDNFVGPIAQQSNRQGVGMMYRVLDVPQLFTQLRKHQFGAANMLLELNLTDTFLPENEGDYLIQFRNGRPSLRKSGKPKVRIGMKVDDFSSLLIGSINFYSLYEYGLVEVSNSRMVETLNQTFAVPRTPLCYTQF